jgi:phosphoglycolate phosphatase
MIGGVDAAMVDLDGTMVDTIGDIVEALNRTLAEEALPPAPRGEVALLIGHGADQIVGTLLAARGAGDDAARLERARRRYREHYGTLNGRHAVVFPGVAEGLGALRGRGMRLACVTNKPTFLARGLLEAMALDEYFEDVLGGDRFERLKPDSQPLLATCAALGTPPSRTLMIGDSRNDAIAARAAGCPVVLVTYGYNHGEPIRAVNADGFVDSLAELAS